MTRDPLAPLRRLSPAVRAYYYRVALAVLGLAVVVDLVTPDQLDGLAELVGAVFGLGSAGLAVANTDRPTRHVHDRTAEDPLP